MARGVWIACSWACVGLAILCGVGGAALLVLLAVPVDLGSNIYNGSPAGFASLADRCDARARRLNPHPWE